MRNNQVKGLAIVAGAFLGAFAIAYAANNIAISGAGGARYVMKTTEGVGGVHTLHVNVDTAGATVSIGSFNQESVLAPITATTGGVSSAAFTANKVVIATNVGTTNIAYCRLGAASSTSGQPIPPNGGWFAFQSLGETQVTCATSTSTTVVNFSVGTGLPTGTGGGGGGSGGGGGTDYAQGSATAGQVGPMLQTAVTTGAPAYVDGQTSPLNMTTNGSLRVAFTNSTIGVTGTFWQATQPVSGTFWQATQPVSIAGTQAVNVAQINGVTTLMGNGATGTGSQRITLANDNTIPTGWPTAANQLLGMGATGAAVPSQAKYIGFNSGGNLVGVSSANPFPVTGIGNVPGVVASTTTGALTQCEATTTEQASTGIASADVTNIACSKEGKQTVLIGAVPENTINPTPTAAITNTTSTSVMVSAGAGVRNYITWCRVQNSDPSVGTFVQILDGATVVDSGYAGIAGGGFGGTYNPPIRGTAATAVNCQATTTGASFKCVCGGYKGA